MNIIEVYYNRSNSLPVSTHLSLSLSLSLQLDCFEFVSEMVVYAEKKLMVDLDNGSLPLFNLMPTLL